MQKKHINIDFCVIGAGSAGLLFAAGAVQIGASVVLLEKNKMGGDCLNTGCVPSKSLIYSADIARAIKQKSAAVGWKISNTTFDFKEVKKHVENVIEKIAPNDSVERFEKMGVIVINEEGVFLNKNTIETKHQ